MKKKMRKKKPAEIPDKTAWRKLVSEVAMNPMYNLTAISAQAGLDVRTASALLQTFYHGNQRSWQ